MYKCRKLLYILIFNTLAWTSYAEDAVKKGRFPTNDTASTVVCKPTKTKPCPPDSSKPKLLFPVFNINALNLPLTPMKIIPQAVSPFGLPKINVDGKIRTYDFIRNFTNPLRDQQSSFSAGGALNAYTDAFWDGFKLAGTWFLAEPFGLNNPNPIKQDLTLPGTQVSVIGQAYGEYKNSFLLLRAGDQLITTPWVNPSDTRMIPSTYQGFLGTVTPITGLDISLIRMYQFKSRTSGGFNKTNVYNPVNVATPIVALGNYENLGFLAVGGVYASQDKSISTQLWGYEFYNFSKMAYADFNYTFNTTGRFKPLAGVQVVRSTAAGADVLQSLGQGEVNATGYGLFAGFELDNFEAFVAYNDIRPVHGGFKNGDIVSPYTSGYISDPLYTTSMVAGLIEKAAGHAYRIAAAQSFFNQQLLFKVSYAKYDTAPYYPNTFETDLDMVYSPIIFMNMNLNKSLSFRYRLGILNGVPANGQFTYGRLMIEYAFA